jgi:hypothetical protein
MSEMEMLKKSDFNALDIELIIVELIGFWLKLKMSMRQKKNLIVSTTTR